MTLTPMRKPEGIPIVGENLFFFLDESCGLDKHDTCATLFLIFCCCRAEQGQNLQFYGIEHGCVWGQVNCEKRKGKAPRPFWCALTEGFFGRAWLDTLLDTLEDVEAGGFIFRSYAGDSLSASARAEWACLE